MIIVGIKYFRIYLEGTCFRIETDHNLLVRLALLKDSHGQIGRWALALQPNNFKITHKPGSKNWNVDGHSHEQGSYRKGVSGIYQTMGGRFAMVAR